MKTISGPELREKWNQFRLSKNHKYLAEASLIGGKESTAMFNIAGMQQLIPYLSGKEHPLGKRLFNIQKCIRTVDIDDVGDASHLTFFEMMGNRSLGDYFKKEAVDRSREFLVDVLGFDKEKLAATVFQGDADAPRDEETAGYRKKYLPENRIAYLPADNNRRSPGPIGPCGPDTEIFYRVGESELPPVDSNPGTDEKNRLEIWNNVFMEYYRSEESEENKSSEETEKSEEMKEVDKKTEKIIGICIDIHKKYGNSLTEKQYQNMVLDFLIKNGFDIEKEKKIEIIEDNKSYGFRYIDLVVDKNIFLELKNNPSEVEIKKGFKQLRSYMNLNGGFAGLLINFGMSKLGINRLNNLPEKTLQTSKSSKFKLVKLANQNVDTGMGYERMCKVLQQKNSVYETDIFDYILAELSNNLNIDYNSDIRRFRIISDHTRTSFFMIKDGITPSNEGRGYVLRRLIRRMYYNLSTLKKISESELKTILTNVAKNIVAKFSLDVDLENIVQTILKECLQFQKTIENGQKMIGEFFSKSADSKKLNGKDIFMLYDTFGFPIELTRELASEKGFQIDEDGFQKEMEQQQERSRKGSKDKFTIDVDRGKHVSGLPATKFVGYDISHCEEGNDEAILLKDFEVQNQRILVFDQTPFYAESGGQVGDKGTIELDNGEKLKIKEVKKYEGVFLHFVE